MAILDIQNLRVGYGPVSAVQGIDLSVDEGHIVALLGANGAGKSSTVNAIAGLVAHQTDGFSFKGVPMQARKTEQRIADGLTLVPEGRRVFPSLSVAENLLLGGFLLKSDRSALENQLDRMYGTFPILAERKQQLAATLSGGQQQQLAIGRALMSAPRLIMLDEPSLGLAPRITETIFDLLVQLRDKGSTLLVVEQNVGMVLEIADYVYVMAGGGIRAQGTVSELNRTEAIRSAYMGGTA